MKQLSLTIKSKEISKKINNFVELDNGKSILTKCPIYERILRKGIVVEIKKMDIHSIDEETIDEIVSYIKNV